MGCEFSDSSGVCVLTNAACRSSPELCEGRKWLKDQGQLKTEKEASRLAERIDIRLEILQGLLQAQNEDIRRLKRLEKEA